MPNRKGRIYYPEDFKEEALTKISNGEIEVRVFSREYRVSIYFLQNWKRQKQNPHLKKKKKDLTELETLQQENEVLKAFHEAITREEQNRNFRL